MYQRYFVLFFLSTVLRPVVLVVADENESGVDTDFLNNGESANYIDPFDMFNYEPSSMLQKTDTVGEVDAVAEPPSIEAQLELEATEERKAVSLLKHSTKHVNSKLESCNTNPLVEREKPFLGRFIRILADTLRLEEHRIEDGDMLYIPLAAVITRRAQFIIQETLKDKNEIQLKNLGDLDSVLSNLFVPDDRSREAPVSSLLEMLSIYNFHIKDCLPLVFAFCLWTVLWWIYRGYSLPFIISRSLVLFFILSWLWHYIYLSQLSSAKRQSDLMKNADIPVSCKPAVELSWADSLISWARSSVLRIADPCEEYHRTLLTDPTYEVTPLTAMVDMLAITVFQPLGFIGKQIGSFFDSLLSSAGLFNKIPVFVGTLFILVLMMMMCFRYEIALPFFKIRPTATIHQPIIHEVLTRSTTRSLLSCPSGSHVQHLDADGVTPDENPAVMFPPSESARKSIAEYVKTEPERRETPPAVVEASTQVPEEALAYYEASTQAPDI